MQVYTGRHGRSYTLVERIKKGKGGEGKIFEVSGQPNVLAKIWHEAGGQRARKLDELLKSKPAIHTELQSTLHLAWPSEVLSDSRGTTAGFLMPKAPENRYYQLVHYCNPMRRHELEKSLGSTFSRSDLLTIARNIALLLKHLHLAGYVVGDVNQTNLLAAPDGSIFLIDVDSIQVGDPQTSGVFRCLVGMEEFTPPRLIGKHLPDVDRAAEDDLFGLAVLTFQLLMNGVHPYDAIDESGPPGNTRVENLRRSRSPFARLNIEQARTYLALEKIMNQYERNQRKAEFLASIRKRATADFATLNLPRVSLWLDLEPEFRDLFSRTFS